MYIHMVERPTGAALFFKNLSKIIFYSQKSLSTYFFFCTIQVCIHEKLFLGSNESLLNKEIEREQLQIHSHVEIKSKPRPSQS